MVQQVMAWSDHLVNVAGIGSVLVTIQVCMIVQYYFTEITSIVAPGFPTINISDIYLSSHRMQMTSVLMQIRVHFFLEALKRDRKHQLKTW